jgi:hypothetical protein
MDSSLATLFVSYLASPGSNISHLHVGASKCIGETTVVRLQDYWSAVHGCSGGGRV